MEQLSFDAFSQLLEARRSVREFLPDPVPSDELEAIFESAGYAPSNCNAQPWKVVVVAGERAAMLKRALADTVGQGIMQMDHVFDDSQYSAEHKQRQINAVSMIYDAAGITREDKAGRSKVLLDNLNFFGAPHAAFYFMPEWAGAREAADVGGYSQSVMLAMRAKGIGSCAQGFLSFNADAVRECLGVEPEYKLLFGMSFGYFDPNRPLNQIRTEREAVTSMVDFQFD